MTDIDALSAAAYAGGRDPLDWAITKVSMLIEVRENLYLRRDNGLPPLPAWQDLGHEALARKILGDLLDAGWRPPDDEDVRAAVEESRAFSARFEAWRAALATPGQWERAIEHYSNTGEFPPDIQPPRGQARTVTMTTERRNPPMPASELRRRSEGTAGCHGTLAPGEYCATCGAYRPGVAGHP